MKQFTGALNAVLMELYMNVSQLEERTIKNAQRIDLTINEMHTIECVGRSADSARTIRQIANDLGIKSPSATVAVNKLVKKGYLEKRQSELDGRVVYVRLTHEGKSAYAYISYYHRLMAKELSDDLEDSEKNILLKAIEKFNIYLKKSIEEQA